MSDKVQHVYQVYIRTTADKLWDALTNPEISPDYFMGGRFESDWRPGSSLILRDTEDGEVMLDCKILEIEKPRKLVQTFGSPDNPVPSKVTWEIEEMGETCSLKVYHEFQGTAAEIIASTQRGWPIVLSGLKTLLETGTPLRIVRPEEAAV